MKRILKWIGMSLVVLLVVIQAIRPTKTNPAVDETRTMKANTQMSPEVAANTGARVFRLSLVQNDVALVQPDCSCFLVHRPRCQRRPQGVVPI